MVSGGGLEEKPHREPIAGDHYWDAPPGEAVMGQSDDADAREDDTRQVSLV